MRRLTVLLLLVTLVAACGDDGGGDESGEDAGGGTPATTGDVEGKTFASTGATGHELVEDTVVSLTFTDGSLAFSAGCNSMTAGYEITDGTLALTSDPAGTLMGCPPGRQDQDEWLVGFLGDSPDATIAGDDLTLTSGDGSLELTAAS